MGAKHIPIRTLAAGLVLMVSSCAPGNPLYGPKTPDETWANADCVIQPRKLTKTTVLTALNRVVDGNSALETTGSGKSAYAPLLYQNARFDVALTDKLSLQMADYFADEGLTRKVQGRPRVTPVTMLAYASIAPGKCLAVGQDCNSPRKPPGDRFLTYATSFPFWPKAHGVLAVEGGKNVGMGSTAIIDRDGNLRDAESGDDPKGADFTVFVLKGDPDMERHIDEISSVLALAFKERTKRFFTAHWDGVVTQYDRLNPDSLPQVLSVNVRICQLP